MKNVVGLVGNVCCGKSTISKIFLEMGAYVYNADAAVHAIYKDPAVIAKVKKAFGKEVIDSNGAVDRKALGKLVFGWTSRMTKLKRIIFPITKEKIEKQCSDFMLSKDEMLLLDAPTLFEAKHQNVCTRLIFVTAPLVRRAAWAATRGWDVSELTRREAMLNPEIEKRALCDTVIENSGSEDDLRKIVKRWMEAL